MEEIVLKWSCNRNKFGQISAANKLFSETLGCVCNTKWKLLIINDTHNTYKGYAQWRFDLKRSSCEKNIIVPMTMLSNNEVVERRYIRFVIGEEMQNLCTYDTKCMVDYRLDLFLIFVNNTVQNSAIEEFQIMKLKNLSCRFKEMFEKEHMTDVVLKCESITLKAHKCVLSIQSPVFKAMFTSPMLERELDTVVIKDMDSSVFHAMISFMYSGRVKVESETMAYDLLYAAEKYQIEALKEGCIEYLKSILSRENAIKILELSNLFDKQLKLHCLDYIKDRFGELKTTKDWIDLKLKNPVLALEVYSCHECN